MDISLYIFYDDIIDDDIDGDDEDGKFTCRADLDEDFLTVRFLYGFTLTLFSEAVSSR